MSNNKEKECDLCSIRDEASYHGHFPLERKIFELCGCGKEADLFISMLIIPSNSVPIKLTNKSFPVCKDHYDALSTLLTIVGVGVNMKVESLG